MLKSRKIIHIDMDCFYAAIEIRDNPALKNQPVAVGGLANQRGVLCTCNYIARKYGIHSAMPTAIALKKCPDLVLLPVNMSKYKQVANRIQAIFLEYTHLVEPLALDEAYLDVSHSMLHQGSATWIAEAIRKKIWQTEQLTASAGVAPNKYLAKIASGWNKPNGIFVIPPNKINEFIKELPIQELYGVGKVTAQKLQARGLRICKDIQKLTEAELINTFGKLGRRLYEQSRGIDERPVEPNQIRKSLSVEHTFPKDIYEFNACLPILATMYQQLLQRIKDSAADYRIKSQYIKVKFNDFKVATAEAASREVNQEQYKILLQRVYAIEKKPIRLLGLGVHFHSNKENFTIQMQSSLKFSDI